MTIRDILVHLDAAPAAVARLDLAAALARRHGARLTGLAVIDIVLPPIAAPDGGGAALGPLLDAMRRDALVEAEGIRTHFEETLSRLGVAGEWRVAEGLTAELVARHGRTADLVVLGQPDPESGASNATAVFEGALFSSGRPVLVVPYAGRFTQVGRRALIAWNGRREAARAVHDALPLLAGAEHAVVLAVGPEPTEAEDDPSAEILRHLARHDLSVSAARETATDLDIADILLNRAAESGADLLVMGAYGHSRLREFILGGATRSILRQMTLPVLMAH
ncbi:MAG: universal stress protein [Roseomonas sp.]|nr:universal stress protein [Roseomonas sp.]